MKLNIYNMKVKIDAIQIPLPQRVNEPNCCAYIISFKEHWWNRWQYIMDNRTKVPALYFSKSAVEKQIEFLRNKTKIIMCGRKDYERYHGSKGLAGAYTNRKPFIKNLPKLKKGTWNMTHGNKADNEYENVANQKEISKFQYVLERLFDKYINTPFRFYGSATVLAIFVAIGIIALFEFLF